MHVWPERVFDDDYLEGWMLGFYVGGNLCGDGEEAEFVFIG